MKKEHWNQESFAAEQTLQTAAQKSIRKGKLRRLVALLSAFVIFITMNTLKFEADTLERYAMCGFDAHLHDASCLDENGQVICGMDEHIHTDACFQQRPVKPEPTVLDEYLPLNSQVVLSSPMEGLEAQVGEVSLELGDDGLESAPLPAENGAIGDGLEIVYDDPAAPISETYEYYLNTDVAFLSDVLNGVGLNLSDFTSVGEVVDDVIDMSGRNFNVEPVEGVDGEYIIRTLCDFDRAELGLVSGDGIKTVWLFNGLAPKAAEPEANTTYNNEETADDENRIDDDVTADAASGENDGKQNAGIEEAVAEDKIELTDRAEETAAIEETEQADQAEETAETAETDKADQPEETAETEQTDKADQPEETAGTEQTDKADQAEETAGTGDVTNDGSESAEPENTRTVELDFTNYIATDEHAVYLYDAANVFVLVNTEEIADADGVEVIAEESEGEVPTSTIVITGDGEYELDGVVYTVRGLVLPEKVVTNEDQSVTIATANEESTLLNVEPVFEESAEGYADIFSLFQAAESDPTLLSRLSDALLGVAYAEEVRTLQMKLFNIGLQSTEDGSEVEPGTTVHVTTSFDAIEGVDFALYHIVDDRPVLVENAVVEENGAAVGFDFEIDSLSPFALVYYTVTTREGETFTGYSFKTDEKALDAQKLLETLGIQAIATGVTCNDESVAIDGLGIALPESFDKLVLAIEAGVDKYEITLLTGDELTAAAGDYAVALDLSNAGLDDSVNYKVEISQQPASDEQVAAVEAALSETLENGVRKVAHVTDLEMVDISIINVETGLPIEPAGAVAVSLTHAGEAVPTVVHFRNDGEVETLPVENGAFTTDSFSAFTGSYTVEYEIINGEVTVKVDFTNIVQNGVDFDTNDVITALNDGVNVSIAELEAGYVNGSEGVAHGELSIDYTTADNESNNNENVNWAAYDVMSADQGLSVADGEIKVSADGKVVLSDGVSTINIVITGYQNTVQKVLGDGATIEALEGELPMGASAAYVDLSDKADELAGAYGLIPGQNEEEKKEIGFSAFDVSVSCPDGELPVEGRFAVTVPHTVEIPEGAEIELYHIHNDVAEKVEGATVENGTVSFETNGFSEYVIRYTVEFHNGEEEVVIQGGSQVLLSTLIERLGLTREDGSAFTVDEVEKVEFTTPELFTVEEVFEGETVTLREEILNDAPTGITESEAAETTEDETAGRTITIETGHDFVLTSEQPFEADQMVLTLTDGEVIGMDVTDDQSTLTTFIKFFAKDAEIIKKDQDQNNPAMHIIGNQEAPNDPALVSTYYVLAVLKDKQDKELGWAIENVTLNAATTQVNFSAFNPFESQIVGESAEAYAARRGQTIAVNSEKIIYDKNINTIETRLYRTDSELSIVNYYELVTRHSENSTYETPEDGYEFGGNFTNGEGTQNEIHLKKANNKKYKVRIYLDEDAVDNIASSDNYYLYLKINHASGDPSYQFVKLDINAATTKGGYVEYEFPHWMDNNGNLKSATATNNTFTGNEQGIEVKLLKYSGDFKPNNYTNATVNTEGSAIKAYKVHYDTKKTNPQSTTTGYHEVEETVDGKTVVNCIDYVELETIDAEGKYNYASILGPNLNYGIVADHFYHENHVQTNFAVNHYTGHGHDARPDLSGSSGGQIVIGEYNEIVSDFWINGPVNGVGDATTALPAGQLKIGDPLSGTLVVYADNDSGATGELQMNQGKLGGNLNQTVLIQTDGQELSENIVEPALQYMDNMSAELAAHTATFIPPIPSQGKLTIETKEFPDDATIFIDADPILPFIGSAGDLIIDKKPNQTIIFNFKDNYTKTHATIKLAQFVVKQDGFPDDGYTTKSPVGTGAPENVCMDSIARHIIWNLYGVHGNASIDISGGVFLQPNEDSVIDVAGTSAGWIVSEGLVSNGSGEWHNVFAEMPETSSVKLHAYKTVDHMQPRVSQKFNFFLDEYDTTVNGNWRNIYNNIKNSTGSVDFPEIKNLSEGWHVYRIHEDQLKPAGTNGYFVMDDDTYYAAVNVKVTTTAGGQAATIVSNPVYYRNFTPGEFVRNSETLTGFSDEDKVSRVVFDNEEVKEGLNILKKVEGTTANNVVFTFKIELWFENGEDISPLVRNDEIGTDAAKFTAVTSEGNSTFTITANENNHSIGTITLKAGELITIQGIDAGAHYQITETKVGDKTISTEDYVDGYKGKTAPQTGDLSNGLASVTFVNEYKAEGKLDLKAHKALTDTTGTGKALVANLFGFRLTGHNAVNPDQPIYNDADGNVIFPTIHYTSADMDGATPDPDTGKLTKTLTYIVHEQHELGDGATGSSIAGQNVTYDDDKTVTVTLVDNGDGTITAKPDVSEFTVEFNNIYEYKVSKTFEGTKVLTGRDMADQEFWFNAVLTKYNDGTTETTYADDAAREAVDFVTTKVEGTNLANGNIVFAHITFKKAGTYTFTVTEDETRLPEDVEPLTPGQSYDVTIVVTEGTDPATNEKILVAGDPTYTNNKTINNTQKKMGFNVTKEWFNVEGNQVFEGHTITFSVTKDGAAFPVTAEHIEKVGTSSTDGSYTVNNDGTVTLTAGTDAWPTVKLKELDYPTTGYAVSETAHTGEADGNFVNTTYSLNAGEYQASSPDIKVDNDTLKIKNTETSTGLHVTKKWYASDGMTDISTSKTGTIYFAIKINMSGNSGYYSVANYNAAQAGNMSEGREILTTLNPTDGKALKVFELTKLANGKWNSITIDKLHTNPWGWNDNVAEYSVVEIAKDTNDQWQEVTTGVTYSLNGGTAGNIAYTHITITDGETNEDAGDVTTAGTLIIKNQEEEADGKIEVRKVWIENGEDVTATTTHEPITLKLMKHTLKSVRFVSVIVQDYQYTNPGNVINTIQCLAGSTIKTIIKLPFNGWSYSIVDADGQDVTQIINPDYQGDGIYVQFVANKDVTVRIFSDYNRKATADDCSIEKIADPEEISVPDSEVETLTLSASNGWYDAVDGLDLISEDDLEYSYYLVENGIDGYKVSYKYDEAIVDADHRTVRGLITVTNTKTEGGKGALKLKKEALADTSLDVSQTNGKYAFVVEGPTGGTNILRKYVIIKTVNGKGTAYKTGDLNENWTVNDIPAWSDTGSQALTGDGYVVFPDLEPGEYTVSEVRTNLDDTPEKTAMCLYDIIVPGDLRNVVDISNKTAKIYVGQGEVASADIVFKNKLIPIEPVIRKMVIDINDSTETQGPNYHTEHTFNDSADYDIGDDVPYRITTTLPSEYYRSADTTKYFYELYDDMTHTKLKEWKMYAFVKTDEAVNGETGKWYDVTDSFTVDEGAYQDGKQMIKVHPKNTDYDLLQVTSKKWVNNWDDDNTYVYHYPYKDPEITEETEYFGGYTSREIRYLQFRYTATLMGDATIGSEGNPNDTWLKYENGTKDHGETETDRNKVFTYRLAFNKVDDKNNKLTGASFELYKKYKPANRGNARDIETFYGNNSASLPAGRYVVDNNTEYILAGSTLPQGVVECEAADSDDIYVLVKRTSNDSYDFVWNGLDDGEYLLFETAAPNGYKPIASPIAITIDAGHQPEADDPKMTFFDFTASGTTDEGSESEPDPDDPQTTEFDPAATGVQSGWFTVNKTETTIEGGGKLVTVQPDSVTGAIPNTPYSGIQIYKIDERTRGAATVNFLKGAEFTIYKWTGYTYSEYALDGVVGGSKTATVTTGENGFAAFSKLEPGEYRISETKMPTGFIKPVVNDIFFKVGYNDQGIIVTRYRNEVQVETITENGQTITREIERNDADVVSVTQGSSAEFGYVTRYTTDDTWLGIHGSAGDVPPTFIVGNMPGASLPSTGGPGTTMFYIVGSILTMLAAVLLITKKRTDGQGID